MVFVSGEGQIKKTVASTAVVNPNAVLRRLSGHRALLGTGSSGH